YYQNDPADFVSEVFGAGPDAQHELILNSIAHNQMTSVRSGHGVGKSAVEAWAVIWFLCTRPFPKVPCTAPTQHQLFDILWAEVAKWIRNNKLLGEELIWTKEKVYMKGHPEEWFAVARTASKPDALQGFHADNVLYIIDEASGVDDKIFEPVLGSLSTPGAKLLMCGNPTQLSGFFYDSHNRNRASYSTFHIDGRQSSRVSPDFVQTIINMYGEDSDVFRVRVAGEFPLAEDDIFIPLPLVMKSVETEYKPKPRPHLIHLAADVARFGDDRTVIGSRIDEKITLEKKINGQDTMKTADNIVELGESLVEKYKLQPKPDEDGYLPVISVKIDDGGVGGGVTDRLRQIKRNDPKRFWWLNVVAVNFGKRIPHKHYYDTTTYMMAVVKKLLQPFDEDGLPKPVEIVLPRDEDMIAQLSGRKYAMTDNSKIRIESKKDMKKRGRPSPDEADCVLLLCLPVNPVKAKIRKE
ncbi:MAG: terminase B, partial [Clostridiales bacterium]|nr:terminase B [Clostridiales bacterium]